MFSLVGLGIGVLAPRDKDRFVDFRSHFWLCIETSWDVASLRDLQLREIWVFSMCLG